MFVLALSMNGFWVVGCCFVWFVDCYTCETVRYINGNLRENEREPLPQPEEAVDENPVPDAGARLAHSARAAATI